jgi:DNA-binding winged helix-turn-helix (wHTH) protein/Tol biopolymer transport system component
MRTKYRFAPFELDLDRGSLTQDGREVALRPKTFHVLRHLVVHHGKLVSKDDLTAAVWTDTAVTDNSLSQCLSEIRRALGDESQTIIRTVARRGYVFDAPIEPDEPAGARLPPGTESPAHSGIEPDRAPGISAGLAERPPPWQALAAALALTIGLGALAALRAGGSSPAPDDPPVQLTNFTDSVVSPSLSRDGRLLAFVRGGSFGTVGAPRGQVYVKQLPSAEPVQLTNDPTSKYFPVFSPDDSTIIYTTLQAGLSWDTWQVSVLRGTPQPFLKNASGTTWLEKDRLIYSTISAGAHMGLVRSTASQDDYTEIYFPAREDGMAHRSAASPDKRSLLVVEMVGGTWTPCRLIPLDSSSSGRRVGPREGQCTSAAWSPDGRWMYFSSNSGGAFHIWRQRYPDGMPEQITFGPTEQEGTAITSDGRYLITSMGLQQSSLWLGGKDGERQLTTERYVTQPSLDPSGRLLYYVLRTDASRGQTSGELWSLDLQSGHRRAALPGMIVSNYSLSRDGRSLLFTSSGAKGGDGVWVVDAGREAPPRRLAQGTDLRAFFTSPDEFVYTSDDNRLHRMTVDGRGDSVVSGDPVAYLSAVSPDGRWAVVIRPSEDHDLFTKLEFMSLGGGRSFTVCNADCSLGPRSFLGAHPFAWSHDGTRMVVNLMHFDKATPRSVSLPYNYTASPEQLWPSGLRAEKDVLATPGAAVINAAAVIPGPTADSFIAWRTSTLSNLYRIRIPDEQ